MVFFYFLFNNLITLDYYDNSDCVCYQAMLYVCYNALMYPGGTMQTYSQ